MSNYEQDASAPPESDTSSYAEGNGDIQPKPEGMTSHRTVKEETIWQYNVTKGIFKKEIVETWTLTNLRAIRGGRWVMLKDCDSIVIANRHTKSTGSGFSTGRYGVRYGTYNSSSKTFGDVQFIKGGVPVIVFSNIPDPGGLSAMAKAARKSLIALIKEAEKEQKAAAKAKPKKEAGILCQECKNENPAEAKFCNGCGKALSSTCQKCNKTNPMGASFCAECGFPLS